MYLELSMKKKKVLLALSTVNGISKLIEENLKYYGFDVINIERNNDELDKFRYPSLFSHLLVKFKKVFFKDKDAKLKLRSKLLLKELYQELDNILEHNGKVDYALFFLANFYSIELLQFIKSKTTDGNMICYHWDGMKRFRGIIERLPLFDRFFVFDPQDLEEYDNLLPTTNFYFDFDLQKLPIEYDFYYLGAHRDDRSELTIQFAKFAQQMNYSINMNVVLPARREYVAKLYPDNVRLLRANESKDFADNLLASRKAKVLLDFVISEHNGLSLRVFEALGHDKKLITTNKDIKKYDFYHPNNIFILEDNFDEIPMFLEKPYQVLDQEIKQKYSFGNWIKYVLNIEHHCPILLPKEK